MNRLLNEKSAYLQHAAHQSIDWYPWSDAAFERADKEDKPVFLSSGAIWCHWCHVMARESFEDPEAAKLLNQYFIAVKIDRDERPDIDRRYQHALAAMGLNGGWPLSIFLTPDKKPFHGGTYFPPNDGLGRPGFKTILKAIGQLYQQKKAEIGEQSRQLADHMRQPALVPGVLSMSMLDEAEENILSRFDDVNGGFGKAPKFPMPGALEFLMGRYSRDKDEVLENTIKRTLVSMAKGGIHDQLGGGFHRYSTDEWWVMPHFEKMADDNAWLLRNFVHAYRLFGDAYFREVSEGTISFLMRELSYADGGLYTSQDADVEPEDEGGYFTWTDEDFKRALKDDEYRLLSLYLLHDRGSMHHNPAKKVLYVSKDIDAAARKAGLDPERAKKIIDAGKARLLIEREKREKPFVDRALYTSINGMVISAFFEAYKAFQDKGIKAFAEQSLNKILDVNFRDGKLFHSEGVAALVDDYVHLVQCLISAYEATEDDSYLDRAGAFMDACIDKFWDREIGGFFDTEEDVIGIRLKGIEDIPHPSANSVGIMALIRLHRLLKKAEYRHYAEQSLKYFSSAAQAMGIHGGYYFCALDVFLHQGKEN